MTADSSSAELEAPPGAAAVTVDADDDAALTQRRLRRLLAAQQLSGLGSWEWDVERNSVDWSDELYRIYGLEPGCFAATFEAYLERVHPDDRERVTALIGEALRTGKSFAFEERIVRPDGAQRVLRSVGECTRAADGRVIRLLGACQDITEERATQQELRRSEAAYRAMFELAADAIFVHDPDTGAILDVNHKGLALHGYTLEELRAGGVALLSTGEQPFTIEEAKRRLSLAAAGTPQVFEWHVRKRSGEQLWVEVRLDRITLPAGDRIIAVVRDVSERRRSQEALQQAYAELERRVAERTAELAQINAALRSEIRQRRRSEQALQRSEEHFRALIENSSDVASIISHDGTVLYQSLPIERVLGWGPAELVGRNALDLVHPEDVAHVAAELQALAADPGVPRRVEFRLQHKDGSYRVLESIGRGHRFGELQGIVVNSRDITDRRAADEERRLQTALLRAQGEASIDGILVVDPAGHIVSWNQRFVELWGIPDHVVESRSDADAIAWVLDSVEDPAAFAARIEHLYAHVDESRRDEIVLKDGRVLDRYSGPVRGADGQHYGRVWYFRDITKRRRNEEALRQARLEAEQARERAERADRAKSEFLSRMSHELRTPLNSILGFAQLLQRKDLPPDQHRAVEYILKGGRHLLNLINEVLEITRIETNPQSLSLEPVEVHAVVQESLALIRPLATERGLGVEDRTVGCSAYVWADRQRLTQVVLNLLSNAVKYNARGGVVRIRCLVDEAEGGRVRIAVEDTGPGIAPDKHERIFTPFERLGAEQSGVEGTGLGLALSRRLCEAMGGTLDFETELGVGSIFHAEFRRADRPTADSLAARSADGARSAHAFGRPATILYIEDNLANLSLIESVMASWSGLELIPALQGRMGIELAQRHAPDLILLDLHLPDLPGQEVLRRLRRDPVTREIPVVVITADAMPGTGAALRAAGANAYLTKPLDLDAFLETLDRLLLDSEGKHDEPQPD